MKQLTHKDWVSKDLSFSKDYNWQAEVNLAKGFNKTVYWYKGKRYI